MANAQKVRLPIFIMSRNRPLFITNYLDSLNRDELDITVYWTAENIYHIHYVELIKRYPDVHWQESNVPLKEALADWTTVKDKYEIGMVTVDDNVSCADWKPEVILDVMSFPTVFGFTLRLHPGIANQKPDGKPDRRGVMYYNPARMKNHWAYVWEMSSTFYRMRDIRKTLFASRCGSINQVEGKGMEIYGGKINKMACYDYAPLFNIFVDTHRDVVLANEDAITNQQGLEIYKAGKKLDVARYTRYRDQYGLTHVMKAFLL